MNNNLNKLLRAKMFSVSNPILKWIDGSEHTTNYITSINLGNVSSQNKYGEKEAQLFRVTPYFGNGSKPVAADDYDLENVEYDITIASMISSPIIIDSNIIHTYICIAENQTDAPIKVSEMGLFIPCQSTSAWTPSQQLMIHREVFDPVTIQPGEAFTFTINFK